MNNLLEYLISKNEKISFAESITGGALVSSLVIHNNASKVLSEAFVLYSNEAKSKYLNIDLNYIDEYGVVSSKVAEIMSINLNKVTNANLCICTTGYASGKDENHAYFSIFYNGKTSVHKRIFNKFETRENNIKYLVDEVIKETKKQLDI